MLSGKKALSGMAISCLGQLFVMAARGFSNYYKGLESYAEERYNSQARVNSY